MSDTNTNDFLNTKASDVPVPVNLPDGKYVLRVQSYHPDKTSKGNTVLELVFKAVEVLDGPEDLDLNTCKTVRHQFYLTEKAAVQAVRFFVDRLGLESDLTFAQLAEEAVNSEVGAIVKTKFVGKNKDIEISAIERFVDIA